MTDFKQKFGSEETLTVTNLHSLANDSYWGSAPFTLTDLPFDILLWIALKTNTSAGSAVGYARLFLSTSMDGGTTWTGDYTGSEGSYAPSTPSAAEQVKNMIPLGVVSMKADETTARVYETVKSVLAAWKGAMPKAAALIVHNKTGQAFDSAGNVVKVTPVWSQSA